MRCWRPGGQPDGSGTRSHRRSRPLAPADRSGAAPRGGGPRGFSAVVGGDGAAAVSAGPLGLLAHWFSTPVGLVREPGASPDRQPAHDPHCGRCTPALVSIAVASGAVLLLVLP